MAIMYMNSKAIHGIYENQVFSAPFSSTSSSNYLRVFTGTPPTAEEYKNNMASFDAQRVFATSNYKVAWDNTNKSYFMSAPILSNIEFTSPITGTITWAACGYQTVHLMICSVGDINSSDPVKLSTINAVAGEKVYFISLDVKITSM